MRTRIDPNVPKKPVQRGPFLCGGRRPTPPTTRIVYLGNHVSVWAWPSRGGLIVLECATALDIDFLGLDPLNLSKRRDRDQNAEDLFCQQLLRLGAKWFDSRKRYGFFAGLSEEDDRCMNDLLEGIEEPLTLMERRWVSVGIPSGGGLWVAEYDTPLPLVEERQNLEPSDSAKVLLARTMEEKSEILRRMGAKFYESVKDYDGSACLKAWEEKHEGEFGPLVETEY
ncbi:MAG: hypothetical protein M1829_001003 [Trizodia sp. TS-e1964]|nr:MAG: hypothetical protein M1829_001003 [Trizodia sp. TS-e1964]